MKNSDIKSLKLPNAEAARKFIEIDDAWEKEHGESILGETKTFLLEVLRDSEDSVIPNAFSNLLNSRLQGKLKALPEN
jgi:hypothetical protein